MTPEELREMLSRAQDAMNRVGATHTEANFEMLRSAAEAVGMKLSGSMRRKSGFSLKDDRGDGTSGLTLADVESILRRVRTPLIGT